MVHNCIIVDQFILYGGLASGCSFLGSLNNPPEVFRNIELGLLIVQTKKTVNMLLKSTKKNFL